MDQQIELALLRRLQGSQQLQEEYIWNYLFFYFSKRNMKRKLSVHTNLSTQSAERPHKLVHPKHLGTTAQPTTPSRFLSAPSLLFAQETSSAHGGGY
jgi:hypothetical protein